MITQEIIKEYLHYDSDTGYFTWIKRSGDRINIGQRAGCLREANSYRILRLNGVIYFEHRLAWLYVHGQFPKSFIDHINGIRYDNRICNLRDVSRSDNGKNMKLPNTNKSGVIGVFWNAGKSRWTARIKSNQVTTHLGHFENKDDAILARKEAEKKLNFHKNHGRKC